MNENINEILKNTLTQESVVELLTKYELYYHIAMGNYIYETIQDLEETAKKIEELHIELNLDIALQNIIDEIAHHAHEEDFEERFEYYVRSRALLHALKDFVNKDTDLLNIQSYIDQKSEVISNDKFFNARMYDQFDSNFGRTYDKFELLVTNEVIEGLQQNL